MSKKNQWKEGSDKTNEGFSEIQHRYSTGLYWQHRMDMMYYHNVDYIMRTVAKGAKSMIDIGTANCPYQEWFDWIPKRVSFDQTPPYQSENVTGIQADFLTYEFKKKYDVCTCLQVLEHIPNVEEFAQKLLTVSDLVIVSVPHRWGERAADDHIHDPVSYEKLTGWMGREANYHIVIQEPFRARVGQRLIAIYDRDQSVGYGRKDFKDRVRRNRFG